MCVVDSSHCGFVLTGYRAHIAAIVLSLGVCACAEPLDSPPEDTTTTNNIRDGKADDFADGPRTYLGTCAADAPSVPYQPVPTGTLAQPDGPEILHTQVGVPFEVRYDRSTTLSGSFGANDCGRHYFVFTLDRASRLELHGSGYAAGTPVPLGLCFARPRFLRIDTPWYTDIWEKDASGEPTPPCGSFVPVGDSMEPAGGQSMELPPGAYELTIDPEMGPTDYELSFVFEALGSAVCGDGIRDAGEGCDDGNQLPLDWCGADCRPQRLDIEPIRGNESTETAQPLDGFRILNFYAPTGEKEVDVYSLNLAAGESVQFTQGERVCRETFVQVFGTDGVPLEEPWSCSSMSASARFTASYDGTHYLRFETPPGGARSISATILP